jgi:hypothetical protein
VGLFRINFEPGDKTLTLTRIASTSVIRFELGPETRMMNGRLSSSSEGAARALAASSRRAPTRFAPARASFTSPPVADLVKGGWLRARGWAHEARLYGSRHSSAVASSGRARPQAHIIRTAHRYPGIGFAPTARHIKQDGSSRR